MDEGRGAAAGRVRLASHEVVSALLFLPLLVASGMAVLALPWWARWTSGLAWRRALRAGADLGDEPPRRGMRPVSVLGVTLAAHMAAFVGLVALGATGLALVVAPLVVWLGPAGQTYAVGDWHPSLAQSFALPPVGLLLLLGLVVALAALARLRFQLLGDLAGAEADDLTRQVHELTSSRASLVDAFEAERWRIERDLHDGAQQRLVGLAMTLGMTGHQARAMAREDDRLTVLADAIESCQGEVEEALRELRGTVRGIHPRVLTDHGLFAALEELAGRPGQLVGLSTSGDDSLAAAPIAAGCYFAITEALANAGKHSGAAKVDVEVRIADRLRAIVQDDGRGGARLDAPGSSGLRGLAERMQTLGGRLELHSPPGGGTRVVVDLPLVPEWADRQD